jgi:hypothetical protein
LRIGFRLKVDIEIHFINTALPFGTGFGVPSTRVQLDLTESLHSEATPYTLVL